MVKSTSRHLFYYRELYSYTCELRRVIVYCRIFLNTLNTAYLIVKICDKMYYFLIKITCLIDSLYFLFVDFIAMPQGRR